MSAVTTAPALHRRRVLAASCLVTFVVGAIYSFSVLRDPLVAGKGVTLDAVLLAYSVNMGISPVPMLLGGWLIDRGWARRLALLGTAAFGTGWVVTGLSGGVGLLVLGYGVLGGLGCGLAYSSCVANALRLYPDRRGTAAGLVIGANGASSVVVAPVARRLVDVAGIDRAMCLLGVAFVVAGALAFTAIRTVPAGYWPAGVPRPRSAVGAGHPADPAVTPRQAVRRPAFWGIFVVFVCGAFSGLMIAANASPIGVAMYGLTTTGAAYAVSAYAAGKMTGGVLLGRLADRLGPAGTLVLVFSGVVAFLTLLLVTRGSAAGFVAGVAGLGVCFGGVMGVMPALVSGRFGLRHQGLNYGIVFSAYAVAAYLAPHLAASIGEGSGDYSAAFLVAVAAAVLGLVVTVLLSRSGGAGRTGRFAGGGKSGV